MSARALTLSFNTKKDRERGTDRKSEHRREEWERQKRTHAVNPFTAPDFKISGLKNAHIHASEQCIWWSYNKSTFSIAHFHKRISSCAHLKGKKGLNDFKFGTFNDRFQSDCAASVAVRGLIASTDLRHKFRRRKHWNKWKGWRREKPPRS